MSKNNIAKMMAETLPKEFFATKSTQMTFAFASPASIGVKKAEKYVRVVLQAIKQTLLQGENVEISGFGKFVVKQKNERPGRNPRTKENAVITARKVVLFKPSKMLRNTVNENQA